MRPRTWVIGLLLLASPVFADEFDGKPTLTVADKAQIQADKNAAHKKIDEKYKGDDSPEARAAKQQAYSQADAAVLEKHGISAKDYLWQNSHNSPDQLQEIRTQTKAIEAKRAAAAAAAAKKKSTPKTPVVIEGFDPNNPPTATSPAGVEVVRGKPGSSIPYYRHHRRRRHRRHRSY